MFTPELLTQARTLLDALRTRGMMLATAESCTGGLLSALLTEIPGSSDVFARGYITYANAAKIDMLGVPADLLAMNGAVSAPVAIAMAEGARNASGADIAVSITGIAGPGGATPGKPVGLVHIACAKRGAPTIHAAHHFTGDRSAVRLQTVSMALGLVIEAL